MLHYCRSKRRSFERITDHPIKNKQGNSFKIKSQIEIRAFNLANTDSTEGAFLHTAAARALPRFLQHETQACCSNLALFKITFDLVFCILYFVVH